MDDQPLPYWHAMHTTAIACQCFSLLGSAIIIISFFVFTKRRRLYNYLLLNVNIADFFWVFWHFTNHIDALTNGHVTTNTRFCTAMGMFTHLGIGWELCWLTTVAVYSAYSVYRIQNGHLSSTTFQPDDRTKYIVSGFCWGAPIVWWVGLGVSTDSYKSTGYYCWVDTVGWRPWLLADGPLLLAFLFITGCYGYIIFVLAKQSETRQQFFGSSYSREIRRYLVYILVYTLWIHPYVGITLMQLVDNQINYLFWLYFLAMVNSLGTFNFFAYGYSEKWWKKLKHRHSKGSQKSQELVHSSTTQLSSSTNSISLNNSVVV